MMKCTNCKTCNLQDRDFEAAAECPRLRRVPTSAEFEAQHRNYLATSYTSFYDKLAAKMKRLVDHDPRIQAVMREAGLSGIEDAETINRGILTFLGAVSTKTFTQIKTGKKKVKGVEKPYAPDIKTIIIICFVLGLDWESTSELLWYAKALDDRPLHFAYRLLFQVCPAEQRTLVDANACLIRWGVCDDDHWA